MIANRNLLRLSALLLVLFAFVATGCGESENKEPTPGSNEVPDAVGGTKDGSVTNEPPPVQTMSGLETGKRVNKPTVLIIRSREAYDKLLEQHFSRGVEGTEPAGTDFKTRQIVALYMPKQEPGTQLLIDGVNEDRKNKKVIVHATVLPPGKGCDTKGQPRYPFHVVETRLMEGEPELDLETQDQSACTS